MIEDKPSLDELTVLEHHGVKGMRWGVRKASSAVTGAKSAGHRVFVGRPDKSGVTRQDKRKALRAENRVRNQAIKEFHSQKWRTQDRDIKTARKNLTQATKEYKIAKKEIKSQREEMGKNAAKIALKKAGTQRYLTAYKANQDTTGELAFQAAVHVGAAVASHLSEKKAREQASSSSTT